MRRSRPALPHRRDGRGGRPLSPAAGEGRAVDRPRGQFLGDQLHFYHPAQKLLHCEDLPLCEQPISTHVATRSPSSASTQVFLPTTTPSCNCNTDTAPPQCHHRRGRHGEGRVQAAADRAAPTPSPTALPASRPSQVGQPAEDAPLTASQAAPGPLTAMRAAPPPLPERPSDLLPLAAARPGYMSGAFHGRARRMHGASAHHTDHDATGGNAIPAATE